MSSITTTGRIVGMDEFARNLNALGQNIGKQVLQKATYGAIAKWRDRSVQLAPRSERVQAIVKTSKRNQRVSVTTFRGGNLQRNIKIKKLREFKGNFSKEARYGIIITKDAFYWRFVEFGVPAYGIPARPFLRNTFAQLAPAAFTELVAAARAYIAKQQKRGTISRNVRI